MGTRHSAGAAALVGAGVGVEPPAAESAGRHLRCRGFRRSGSGLPALRAFAAAVCLRFSDFRRFRSVVHRGRLISQCQCTGLSREQCTVWGSSTRPTRVAEAVVERTVDSTPLLLSRTDIRIVMSVVIISSRQESISGIHFRTCCSDGTSVSLARSVFRVIQILNHCESRLALQRRPACR